MLVVQCDFDDTITVGNVSTAVREAFASEEWVSMDEEYHSGKYSVEESNIRQYKLITASLEDIQDFVLSTVMLRPAFDEFVAYCNGVGIRLAIVSSGLDIYISPILKQLELDIEVFAGKAIVNRNGVDVEYTDPSGAVITQGFKSSYVRHFKSQGHTVVYIGDGLSDIAPAQEADFVVARDTLQAHFEEAGLQSVSFLTFDDVGKAVEEVRKSIGASG